MMRIVYMKENGDTSHTLREYVDGVWVERLPNAGRSSEFNKEKVQSIFNDIERAAKVEGLKKFSVNYIAGPWKSISEMNPLEIQRHEREKDYIEKAMELAEARGYKFTGDITLSDKPVNCAGTYSPENSGAFKRLYFIEFEETVTHPPETIDSVEIVKVGSWYKPWTWFVG